MRSLKDYAEIRQGNRLLILCQGTVDGKEHCGGRIIVPFDPPLDGFSKYDEFRQTAGLLASQPLKYVWQRTSGTSLEDLTLHPSVDAGKCGHFWIRTGQIV